MRTLLAVCLMLCLLLSTVSACAFDTLTFGSFEQDNDLTNGPEPITWLILDTQDSRMLLLSESILEALHYHTKYNNSTNYASSFICTYLNEDFPLQAFTEEEKARILPVVNENPSKKGYKSKGGEATEDLVFLLSFEELETYFPLKADRSAAPTLYARAGGIRVKQGCSPWWLRTPGREQHHASCVTIDGGYYDYFDITCPTNGIRPAMWITIE